MRRAYTLRSNSMHPVCT